MEAVIVVALVLLVVGFLLGRGSGGLPGSRRTPGSLRSRYKQMLHLPPHLAEETVVRQLEGVRSRFPGKSERWYFDWLIRNLQRERR